MKYHPDIFIKIHFMEKILLALDSRKLNSNAIRFACYLTRLTNSKLTGIFLENLELQEEFTINETEGTATLFESISIGGMTEDDNKIIEENMKQFQLITEEEEVDAFINLEIGIPEIDLINKTRYADLLVMDANSSFSTMDERAPTSFVKDILQEAECPVVIAPENVNRIDNIVFCYNGNKSSVFAMKQFNYLFPELSTKSAKVIYLGPDQEPSAEEVQDVTDWLRYHYIDVEFVNMDGDATEALFDYMLQKKNDFIVMGSYGKGMLASFFKNDQENETARTTSLPIFVAHY
jgi:hypothetical protein